MSKKPLFTPRVVVASADAASTAFSPDIVVRTRCCKNLSSKSPPVRYRIRTRPGKCGRLATTTSAFSEFTPYSHRIRCCRRCGKTIKVWVDIWVRCRATAGSIRIGITRDSGGSIVGARASGKRLRREAGAPELVGRVEIGLWLHVSVPGVL